MKCSCLAKSLRQYGFKISLKISLKLLTRKETLMLDMCLAIEPDNCDSTRGCVFRNRPNIVTNLKDVVLKLFE
jgi:hypothetical protein